MFVLMKTLRIVAAGFCLTFVLFSGAYAQKWGRLAPIPEPAEEVYGIAAGGKLYVFGGLAPQWTPKGMVYEHDPGADKWTKKKDMPLASHHVAFAELNEDLRHGRVHQAGKRPDGLDPDK